MKKVIIKGRRVLVDGVYTCEIVGHRPHMNDLDKGVRADFALFYPDKSRVELRGLSFFADVCAHVKLILAK